jgi:NitT/TauT family transport system substrate-binding protein
MRKVAITGNRSVGNRSVMGLACAGLMRVIRFAALLLLAVLSGVAPAFAGTPVHFTLGRGIDGTAAPFFLAIDQGYFKNEGLDVTIDVAAGGAPEAFDRLAAAKADMALSDVNLLIKFRDSGGAPIKAVFTLFDKPPYAIIARKSRGVAAPRDLQGKKLGTSAADPTDAVWPIFAKVAGIDADKVAVEELGAPVRQPMLAAGEIDAITGFSFVSYVDLKASGVPLDDLTVLMMADDGIALYADAIMVSPGFAQQKPEAVRAFLRAVAAALKDTVRDPARAIEAVLRRNANLNGEIELDRLRMAIRDNIVTPAVKVNGFGSIDPDRFATAIEQVALAYRFKAKDKAAATFDSSFLPAHSERSLADRPCCPQN